MANTQTPTVGRVVHYWNTREPNQNFPGPYAATIAAVHNDNCITLAVMMPWRETLFIASSCMHKDSGGEGMGSYWDWPAHV